MMVCVPRVKMRQIFSVISYGYRYEILQDVCIQHQIGVLLIAHHLNYPRQAFLWTCLTAAGCYLCPASASKSSKILICWSVGSSLPVNMEVVQAHSTKGCISSISHEVEEIVETGNLI